MNEWIFIVDFILLLILIKILKQEAVFIPLPGKTIRNMLELAGIKKSDVVYDLGSGNGKVLYIAAKHYGVKAVGIEKNGLLCWISKFKTKSFKNKVNSINGDIFDVNLSGASIVTLYLTQKLNDRIENKLEKELKKGTRIVSADHVFKYIKCIKSLKSGHLYLHLYKI
ncbi:MAG TPA: hypothetical protein VJH34_00965 [archaeon]|nr:hypothetical protein [archaeon]